MRFGSEGYNSQASPLSPWWRHAVIIVMIFGFATLSILTVLTYTNAPPIPQNVVDEAGKVLFTKQNIDAGQDVFLKYGLMEHGTLWDTGHISALTILPTTCTEN